MDDAPGESLGAAELREALRLPDPADRTAALDRTRPGPGMDQVLLAAARDRSAQVRRAAVRALGRVGGPSAARALAERSAEDPSPAVRGEAVAAIGRLLASGGDEEAAGGAGHGAPR